MKFDVKRDIQVMMQSRIITLSAGVYETDDKEEIDKLSNVDGIEVVKEKSAK